VSDITPQQQSALDELDAILAPKPQVPPGRIIVAYSVPGVGKTSMFCQSTNGILVQCKDYSAEALKHSGAIRDNYPVIDTTGYYNAIEVLNKLAVAKRYNPVVIDGGSGLHSWSDAVTLSTDFGGDVSKFVSYGKGDNAAQWAWRSFTDAVNELKANGIWVYILCHKDVKTEKNAGGEDYYKNVVAVGKEKRAELNRFADAVLFMDFIVYEKDGKATGGEQRVMYCQPSAYYDAKNRMGLPPVIKLGDSPQEAYAAFIRAVRDGKKQSQGEAVNAG
jgi:hypothetical protein